MNNQTLKTLADNGFDTMMVYFQKNPNHPSRAKFLKAISENDMEAAFAIFTNFLMTLEKTCGDKISLNQVLEFHANK